MLKERLQKIYDICPPSQTVADIGTDHGYLAVELIKNNKADKVIATDISPMSLEKSIQEGKRCNIPKDKLIFRCGNGLEVLKKDEADVVIIAGMGGELISKIIDNSYKNKFSNKKPLFILQPVQNPEKLRKFLKINGFGIESEHLVKEQGKIYHIISAKKTPNYDKTVSIKDDPKNDLLLYFGEMNIKQNTDLYKELLDKTLKKHKRILKSLLSSENKESSELEKQVIYRKKTIELLEVMIVEAK